jgi:hypothetical protein
MATGTKTALFNRKTPGGVFAIEDQAITTGDRWFVDSNNGATTNSGTSPDDALAGLEAAVQKCTANRGDIIYVMPGHAENVATAGAIDLDIEGISVIGLGNGDNRPQFTFITNTTADIDIDADNIKIKNIIFRCNKDALAAPIDVNKAYCTIEDCEFIDLSTLNAVRWILTDANANYMRVSRCINRGTATAGNTAFITLVGSDHVIIEDCISEGDFGAANIEVITTTVTDVLITRNHLENANAIDVNIELFAAATGWVSFNSMRVATDAQTTWINTPGNASLFENYGVNNNGETGILAGTPSV